MARQLRRRTSTKDIEPVNDVHTEDDEAQDDAPARGRRRGSARGQREEAEESPRRGKRSGGRKSAEPERKRRSGWDGYEEAKSEVGDFAPEFGKSMSEDERLFKFVDDGPVAVYSQHWINERQGKKSFTCAEEDCPLCEQVGDRPSTKAAFNVINLDGDEPVVEIWTVGMKVANAIKALAKQDRTKPINREDLYWSVNRTGKKGSWQTNLTPVKARDLKEDWDLEPLTDKELDDLEDKAYGYEDAVENTSMQTLEDVADEMLD